ncbi:hypothetical protein F5Y04DRAFT_241015 [Hypomontagnella monticulosa]|nr:hypothetical protein F5Y04DRAFT_241015 [Hypomontagnella monticulosa]
MRILILILMPPSTSLLARFNPMKRFFGDLLHTILQPTEPTIPFASIGIGPKHHWFGHINDPDLLHRTAIWRRRCLLVQSPMASAEKAPH